MNSLSVLPLPCLAPALPSSTAQLRPPGPGGSSEPRGLPAAAPLSAFAHSCWRGLASPGYADGQRQPEAPGSQPCGRAAVLGGVGAQWHWCTRGQSRSPVVSAVGGREPRPAPLRGTEAPGRRDGSAAAHGTSPDRCSAMPPMGGQARLGPRGSRIQRLAEGTASKRQRTVQSNGQVLPAASSCGGSFPCPWQRRPLPSPQCP